MHLELLSAEAKRRRHSQALLFVHGSFCGAWVWQEHFLPYFANQGFDTYAVSLRGHGASGGDLWSASLDDYVEDLKSALRQIDRETLLIGHSLGGMVVQKFLEKHAAPGAVLLASLPPQGLSALTIGMFLRDPFLLQQIYLAEANLMSAIEYHTLRNALFSPDLPEAEARNYLRRNTGESLRVLADLSNIRIVEPERVRANAPIRVVGAANDALVSVQMSDLTARTYHTQSRIVPQLAHAVMLDTRWERAAEAVNESITELAAIA